MRLAASSAAGTSSPRAATVFSLRQFFPGIIDHIPFGHGRRLWKQMRSLAGMTIAISNSASSIHRDHAAVWKDSHRSFAAQSSSEPAAGPMALRNSSQGDDHSIRSLGASCRAPAALPALRG